MPPTRSQLDRTLDRFFDRLPRSGEAPSTEPVVVAFSGGPDSTALLLALARRAARRGLPRPIAAHLDHALDRGSAERARRAVEIARRIDRELGLETVVERRPVLERARPGESPETAARRVRYRFLEEVRLERGGRWIATAHHRDDQAETVLLRILYGTGPEGLAAIPPVRGPLVRPLLALRRSELAAAVREAGLEPTEDPTNRDPAYARVRVRHALLPHLADAGGVDRLVERLARVAGAAAGARRRLGEVLEDRLRPLPLAEGGVAVAAGELAALPEPLLPHALALLHRRAGAPYPAGAGARAELARQLADRAGTDVWAGAGGGAEAADGVIGCDAGGGWRWRQRGGLLELRPPGGEPAGRFSYTLRVPGEIAIPEIGLTLRVERRPVAPWMFRGSAERAALALPVEPGDRLLVRNRRPGDRLRPLGAPGTRKLKDVLIDRRIPRDRRNRLPLLCVLGDGEHIAWVPGVTVDEAYRVPPGAERTWIAEVVP